MTQKKLVHGILGMALHRSSLPLWLHEHSDSVKSVRQCIMTHPGLVALEGNVVHA